MNAWTFQHFLTTISHDFPMLQGSASLFLGDWTVVFRCQKLHWSLGRSTGTYLEDIPDTCGYIPDDCKTMFERKSHLIQCLA